MRNVLMIMTAVCVLGTAEQCHAARFTAEFYARLFPSASSQHEEIFRARDEMTDIFNRMSTLDTRVVSRVMGTEAREDVELLLRRYEIYRAAVVRAADAAEGGALREKDEIRALRSIALAEKTYAQFVDITKHFHGVLGIHEQ